MVGRTKLAVALSVSFIGSLNAQSGSHLPPLVEAARRDVCDGAPAKTEPGFLRSGDLNGDGQLDFVFDQSKAECTGGAPPACGSGGCSIDAYVSSPNGYRKIDLSILGFSPTIDAKTSPPRLTVSQRTGQVLAYIWNGNTLVRPSIAAASTKHDPAAKLSGAGVPAKGPADVVSKVIAASRSERPPLFSFDDKPTAQMRTLFTTGFNYAWAKAMSSSQDGPVIDGDPVTGKQGVTNVKLRSVDAGNAGGDAVTVVARIAISAGGAPPEDETIRFAMRKESGAWKVDDIAYDFGPSGMRMDPIRAFLRKTAGEK